MQCTTREAPKEGLYPAPCPCSPQSTPAPGPAQGPCVNVAVGIIVSPLPRTAPSRTLPGCLELGFAWGVQGEGRVIHGFRVCFRPTDGISARRGL